jgi:uncharacterized protein (TIGR01244 family)
MNENTPLFMLLSRTTLRSSKARLSGEAKTESEIRLEFLKAPLRKVSGLVLLLLFNAAVVAPQEPAKDASSIKNFLRVNEQFCTGGQPTMTELEKLKREGVRAIINLRRPGEYNAEVEAAKARELGLRYVNIPVDHSDPKDSQVEDFLRATDDPANRPAFIHCAAANRVGTFWMIRRVLRDRWSVEKAEDEATKIGMRSPNLREFALDYIQRQKKL